MVWSKNQLDVVLIRLRLDSSFFMLVCVAARSWQYSSNAILVKPYYMSLAVRANKTAEKLAHNQYVPEGNEDSPGNNSVQNFVALSGWSTLTGTLLVEEEEAENDNDSGHEQSE